FEGLSGGLRIHPWHITHKPLRIKKQEVNHNILGSPTQMCDAALIYIHELTFSWFFSYFII
ncbi:MAG: hypothetical protein WBN77_01985, partial [Desulfobacterales bacterium]